MTQLNGLAALTLLAAGPLFAACQSQPIEATGQKIGGLGDCKSRDQIPPPSINAPNGGACPALGSDCQNQAPINLCTVGDRRMVLACDTVTKTWKVSLEECSGDGGVPTSTDTAPSTTPSPASTTPTPNTPPSATCKPHGEIPPPLAPGLGHGVGPDGVQCVPEGTACDFRFALCTDKDGLNVYMECDNTKHTWYIVYRECP
jgi:hypothetical protein